MSDNIGILDPDGINPNPLTGEEYSDTYKELSSKWREFPAYENAHDVIHNIKEHQVILITSGTGSGKTVLLPKYCLHALDYKGAIAVTLPKQIIAKSAAVFAAATLDVTLGKEVGYQYRGSDKSGKSNDNKLLYATDGTIVARLLKDPELKDFDAVIIDEAHERKVQIDFLLYLLRNVISKRPDFKLIIMSATINVTIFEEYYKEHKFIHIDIGGKTNHPIESIFLDKDISPTEYLTKGIETIKTICKKHKEGDILFFVTSINETMQVCDALSTDLPDNNHYCVEVYSGIDKGKQELAQDRDMYKEVMKKNRKIVIATNVAESSLTIDGIKFVVDSGLELSSYYDPKIRSKVLVKQLITHAQAKQRMGRAGRTEPGTCYHLYSKKSFDKGMDRFPKPTIRTSNLYDEFVKLLNIEQIGTLDNLRKVLNDFIEPPDSAYINTSIDQLTKLNIIDDTKLTELGHTILNMQMDPMASLTVLASYQLNCMREVIGIISMIEACKGSMTELFNLPIDIVGDDDSQQLKYLNKKFDTAKSVFNNRYGDHLSLLKMFKTYLTKVDDEKKVKEWIYKYFLKRSTFEKARNNYKRYSGVHYRIRNNIQKKDIANLMDYDISYRILASFMFGYRLNLGTASKKGISTDHIKSVNINRYSFVNHDVKQKKLVLYYELFTTSKDTNMNIVSSISKKVMELFEQIKI